MNLPKTNTNFRYLNYVNFYQIKFCLYFSLFRHIVFIRFETIFVSYAHATVNKKKTYLK